MMSLRKADADRIAEFIRTASEPGGSIVVDTNNYVCTVVRNYGNLEKTFDIFIEQVTRSSNNMVIDRLPAMILEHIS